MRKVCSGKKCSALELLYCRMGREITIYVGELYANQHEQLQAVLGEEYNEQMRNVVEDAVHDMTKRVERQTEVQAQQPPVDDE